MVDAGGAVSPRRVNSLTADYPPPTDTARTTPGPATDAPPSADTLDLDDFGLESRHFASGKRDRFSPRDGQEKSSSRKDYCDFRIHFLGPKVGWNFNINETTPLTNIKQRDVLEVEG